MKRLLLIAIAQQKVISKSKHERTASPLHSQPPMSLCSKIPGTSVFNSPWQLFSIWISLLFREMWNSGIHKFLWQWDLQLNYTLCKVCASFWRRNSYPELHVLGTADPSFLLAARARSRSRGVAAPAAKLCASVAALLSSASCSMCKSCFVGQLQVQLGLLAAQWGQVTFHLWAPWTFTCQSPVADETVVIFMQNKPMLNWKNPNQLISHFNNNVHFSPNCISHWL